MGKEYLVLVSLLYLLFFFFISHYKCDEKIVTEFLLGSVLSFFMSFSVFFFSPSLESVLSYET